MLAKFDAKAMQEERDYFALLNTQSKAESRKLLLQKDHDEALKAREPLEKAARKIRIPMTRSMSCTRDRSLAQPQAFHARM